MATPTEIVDQYVRDSRYGTSSKVPQAGKKKQGKISNGGTATMEKRKQSGVDFKGLFDRM